MTPDLFFSMLDPDWLASQIAGGNPWPFLMWTLFIATLSFFIGRWWREARMDRLVEKELGRRQGFERVNTVQRLIDKAHGLPSAEQLHDAEKRAEKAEAELGSLRKSLDLATANAERELIERDENLESVRVRQELLNELASAKTPEMMRRIILERLDESRPSDNQKYGAALKDLVKYGCVVGVSIPDFANGGTYVPYTGEDLSVARGDYPSLRERERMDLLREVQGMIDETIGEFAEDAIRRIRMG